MSPLTDINIIRKALAALRINFDDRDIAITVSVGLTQFNEGETSHTFIQSADNALYRAKENGRNRIEIEEA